MSLTEARQRPKATAHRLAQDGRSVVLLEGLSIGGQVTGGSTAKITTQHRLIYRNLLDTFGPERARAYAEANATACATIRAWIVENDLDCDLETRAAYTYVTEAAQAAAIEAEAQAARSLGLAADVLDRAPLPFETGPALCFLDQAQFNPAAYLVGLARTVTAMGVRLFERSRARTIEEGERWRVVTDDGEVIAQNIVVATNLTVKSPVGMANRTRPRMHPVLGFRIEDPKLVDGMFISADEPTHSFRTGRDGDGLILLSLGPRFDTGHVSDVAALFIELENWTRRHFQVGEPALRWCNEDYDTPDRIPYVGEPDPDGSPGFYIATGFNAWGISNGTAAGLLIAHRIAGRENPWTTLYDPTRPAPDDFNPGGDSASRVSGPDAIAPGTGGIFKQGEEEVAAFRAHDGTMLAHSARCTHKGCTLTWNNADGTWDCPCHASIFSSDGRVLHGPARDPLAKVEL
jgi:glycine/D-amino acid oxidase-like deaminating enzyme/nitrite reductase/ring-hydroxylating ferredoxin subunit